MIKIREYDVPLPEGVEDGFRLPDLVQRFCKVSIVLWASLQGQTRVKLVERLGFSTKMQ
jgi:hypothetical protein